MQRNEIDVRVDVFPAGEVGDVCDLDGDGKGVVVLGSSAVGRIDDVNRHAMARVDWELDFGEDVGSVIGGRLIGGDSPFAILEATDALLGVDKDGDVVWQIPYGGFGARLFVCERPEGLPWLFAAKYGVVRKRVALLDVGGAVLWQHSVKGMPMGATATAETLLYVDGRALWSVDVGTSDRGQSPVRRLGLDGYMNSLAATNALAKEQGQFVVGLDSGGSRKLFLLDGEMGVAEATTEGLADCATAPHILDSEAGRLALRVDETPVQEQLAGFSDSYLTIRIYDESCELVYQARIDTSEEGTAACSGGVYIANEDPLCVLVGYASTLARFSFDPG